MRPASKSTAQGRSRARRRIKPHVGAMLSPGAPPPAPLTDGPDISWLKHIRPGDNQGRHGACGIFAICNWAETVYDVEVPDETCFRLYAGALARLGRPDGSGLTAYEAFDAVRDEGIIGRGCGIYPTSDIEALRATPILATYAITPNWERVNGAGCLDHSAPTKPVAGYHFVLLVAKGSFRGAAGGPYVVHENSWGRAWGHHGLGIMSYRLHEQLCVELWRIA